MTLVISSGVFSDLSSFRPQKVVYASFHSVSTVYDKTTQSSDSSCTLNHFLMRLPLFSPEKRQTMLFSATQTRKVEDLARISLKREPLYVGVDDNKDNATVDGLEQVLSATFLLNQCYTDGGLALEVLSTLN